MMLGRRDGDGPGEFPGDDWDVRRMGLSDIVVFGGIVTSGR